MRVEGIMENNAVEQKRREGKQRFLKRGASWVKEGVAGTPLQTLL